MIRRPGLVVFADDDNETTIGRVEYDREPDADFIAHAREDVPWLLEKLAQFGAVIDGLVAENERARQLLAELRPLGTQSSRGPA